MGLSNAGTTFLHVEGKIPLYYSYVDYVGLGYLGASLEWGGKEAPRQYQNSRIDDLLEID